MSSKIITRFPPSPTGNLHIGNIRTMLFNYLFTRKQGGEIVMRFEDTDTQRSSKEFEVIALETLEALGLEYDHGPFRQSERTDRYVAALQQLIEKGVAYVAEESEGEPGKHIVRFRNPNKKITFVDVIRGEITIDTTDFGDFIIARSETNPLYHLSVVVDDLEMGITHVIRGEDHITSTPRQILLIEALGGSTPVYAHLPLIIGPDKKKLGKRHGAVTYQEFRELGYIPAGIINYLALLGWHPSNDQEFFTKEELVQTFSLERVNNSSAMFSYEKLDSINKYHLSQLPQPEYLEYLKRFLQQHPFGATLLEHPHFDMLVEMVLRERIEKFSDILVMIENGELDWLTTSVTVDVNTLVWKETPKEATREHLEQVVSLLLNCPRWSPEVIKEAVWSYADACGRGDVLWPTRYALTGQKKSPDPFTVAALLGKEETVNRLRTAVELLK